LCERTLTFPLPVREEGQVELFGRHLTDLTRVQVAKKSNTLSTKNTGPRTEIVSDDFPVLQCERCLLIVQNHLRCVFAEIKLCAHFL